MILHCSGFVTSVRKYHVVTNLYVLNANRFVVGQQNVLNCRVLAFDMKYDERQLYSAALYFFRFMLVLINATDGDNYKSHV